MGPLPKILVAQMMRETVVFNRTVRFGLDATGV